MMGEHTSNYPTSGLSQPLNTRAHTHMHGPTHMEVYTHNILGTGYVPILKYMGSEAPI